MKQRLSKSVESFPMAMAYCHLAPVFRPLVGRSGVNFLAILVAPDAELAFYYDRAAEFLIAGKSSFKVRQMGDAVLVQTVKRGSAKFERILGDSLEHRPTVWVFECLEDVPPEFRAAADIYQVIGEPDLEVYRAAIYQMCGTHASDDETLFVSNQSWKQNAAMFRRGRSLQRTLHLLRQTLPSMTKPPETADELPIDVESLVGYGAAQTWGLQLIRDITAYRAGRLAWRDVDPGVLLSGPTGCGKTRFAQALANSTGMPLISASPGRWQAAGHLGDYLREMRKAFDDARNQAPAILLIDEIESLGNRSRTDDYNHDYNRQVTNAALECLDGAVDREGVVVIGTTNFPEYLDPAFLRPRRLDRHIRISLPDAAARITILENYLNLMLSREEADDFALATEDWSGSDLEKLARETRHVARLEDRAVTGADVYASLSEKIQQVPAERLFTTAMHECGHAIVGLLVGRQIEKMEIAERYSPHSNSHKLGGVHFLASFLQRRTMAYYLDEIAICFGGIAAELEVLGSYDDGSGGSPQSDLVRATKLATLMEACYGMGNTLIAETYEDSADIANLRLRSPNLWKRVDAVLTEQMTRAIHLIRSNRPILDSLVETMVEKKRLSGAELDKFVRERGFQPNQPDTPDSAIHDAALSL